MNKLKPIVMVRTKNSYFNKNAFQQNILLKALTYTTDLTELKDIAKFHTESEVLRTLDKLSIRREYHDALIKNGLDLNYAVSKIKEICDSSDSDKVRLAALQGLLKSLGLEKYDVVETPGKNWEEILLQIYEKERTTGQHVLPGDYEVKEPVIPESERIKRARDKDIEKGIYE